MTALTGVLFKCFIFYRSVQERTINIQQYNTRIGYIVIGGRAHASVMNTSVQGTMGMCSTVFPMCECVWGQTGC